jgi:hypothetical protein
MEKKLQMLPPQFSEPPIVQKPTKKYVEVAFLMEAHRLNDFFEVVADAMIKAKIRDMRIDYMDEAPRGHL